ncbi:MAG TPA: AAA family ATPase [Streptosporangiaceae bacterium]|nr:AAA family ATPase [Streptosporangiaceae bacterium]
MTEGSAATSRPARSASLLMPLWTLSLGWELRRGRQVVLHGEINDRYWLDGTPVGFRRLLVEYLETTGAEVIGWWDPVDGLTFPVDGHEKLFRQMVSGHLAAAADPESGAATQPDPESAGPEPAELSPRRARMEAASQRVSSPVVSGRIMEIHDVLGSVRRVAARSDLASAFVLQDIDAVLRPDREDAATEYLLLRAAMNEAVIPRSRHGAEPHARNPVLVVTGDASRLPPWFCQEDPRVKPLRIARPDAAERRLWLSMLRREFNGVRDDADIEPLVGATEGLAGWQIDALARTSVLRDVPVQKITRLLDAYHFNVRTNPWTQLDAQTVANSGTVLAQRVIGQDVAVNAVAQVLQTAYAGVDFGSQAAGRPRGVFFFVGPTGVGKTELAKAVAALIFGDESALARFDMSEYAQPHAAERLAGAPPGFVGYEQGGELTRRVQERPFSVLLFDEIEKANTAVLDKFLQILEDGRLTDGRGETANFSQCLIIFTSNTGASGLARLLSAAPPGAPVHYDEIDTYFKQAVKEAFDEIERPEIFGRLEPGVVVFDMLRPRHVAGITGRLVELLAESVHERHGITLIADRDAVRVWVENRMKDPDKLKYGGRQIRSEMEQVRAAYVRYYVTAQPPPGAQVRLTVDPEGNFTVGEARAEDE